MYTAQLLYVLLWYFLNRFGISFRASWHYCIINAMLSETPRAALKGQNSLSGICHLSSARNADER